MFALLLILGITLCLFFPALLLLDSLEEMKHRPWYAAKQGKVWPRDARGRFCQPHLAVRFA